MFTKKHIGLFTLLKSDFTSKVNANSAFEKSDGVIKYRQAIFQLIKVHIKDMGNMLKGKVEFDAAHFHKRADNAARYQICHGTLLQII